MGWCDATRMCVECAGLMRLMRGKDQAVGSYICVHNTKEGYCPLFIKVQFMIRMNGYRNGIGLISRPASSC